MNRYLIFLCVGFAVMSCEKQIELDAEEKAPRIVINGIFSAGDTIRVQLSESRDILYEDTLPNLYSADAKLFDVNDNLLGSFVHEGLGYYYLPGVIPQAGATYKITVASAGLNTATATTTLPSVLSISQIDTTRKGSDMEYNIHFNDNGSEANYYALNITKLYWYYDEFTMDTTFYSDTYFCSREIFIQNGYAEADGQKCGNVFLFSDESFNGQTASFTGYHYLDEFEDSTLVTFTLRSVSEDYYKYKVSLDKYQQTQGSPFAQPVQVYSNVVDGFGIFGGYSSYSDTLLVP